MSLTFETDPRTADAIASGAGQSTEEGLVWLPELSMGYLPIKQSFDYEDSYLAKYIGYEEDGSAQRLSQARLDFVRRFLPDDEPLLDIGIGAGTFVWIRGGRTYGYDINAWGQAWLVERSLWRNPFAAHFPNASFWDSLEHTERPDLYLKVIPNLIFISMPIYHDLTEVLGSKHFKPNEHLYYFTKEGLIQFFDHYGFNCLAVDDLESSKFRREGILSFAFQRFSDGRKSG